MKDEELACYWDVLEYVIPAAALGVGSQWYCAPEDREELEQEAWQAMLDCQLPPKIQDPVAFFGTVAKRRMTDWCRKQQRHVGRTELLYPPEWDGLAQDDDRFRVRSTRPEHRDHYNARRSHLEDYHYI